MKAVPMDGGESLTASGPANGLPTPPRISAPGKFEVVLAPARHMASLLKPPQSGQLVDWGTQSATHSAPLPTMSKAPRAETHALREPVGDVNVGATPGGLQSVVPLSGP